MLRKFRELCVVPGEFAGARAPNLQFYIDIKRAHGCPELRRVLAERFMTFIQP